MGLSISYAPKTYLVWIDIGKKPTEDQNIIFLSKEPKIPYRLSTRYQRVLRSTNYNEKTNISKIPKVT